MGGDLMGRQYYLSLCQKCSTLPKGVQGTRINIPTELLVKCDGIDYYPVGYKLTFDNGKALHTAILHGLKANYILECDLQKVEGTKNEEK
jgi:hypothetical protein